MVMQQGGMAEPLEGGQASRPSGQADEHRSKRSLKLLCGLLQYVTSDFYQEKSAFIFGVFGIMPKICLAYWIANMLSVLEICFCYILEHDEAPFLSSASL